MQCRISFGAFVTSVALFAALADYATPASAQTPSASPTASPVIPLAGGSPSAVPSDVASPLPSPSPAAPSGLAIARTSVALSPRQIVAVGISGASGPVSIAVSNPTVTARFDSATSSLVVSGVALGTATVTVADASGSAATLAVAVLAPAGVIPPQVTVALGGTVSPQFADARIVAAIQQAAQLQPGATVTVRGVTIANALSPGDVLEAVARVGISAGTAFADQLGTTDIHLQVEALAQLDPAILFYSDDPERLTADGDGVLYRGTMDAARPARLYAYHVSDTPARKLWLVLHTRGSASVQILGYAAGPANAFAYVGHVSTLQYLLERSTQESAVVAVSAAAPYVQELGYRALGPGELVAAIFDARVVTGDAVDVEVIATSGADDPVARAGDPEHAGDGHGRRGEFALATVAPLALAYAAGGPEPEPFAIGEPTIPNLRSGGRALGGDYGALRTVALQLSNPAATPQTVYFYEQPAGGAATTSIWFTGDPRPLEIPCVKVPQNRYLVKSFTLDAGETRAVGGEYMTDGSASFPLEFGLTMVAPSPPPGPYAPDACNPKTPPATPSPSPEPSASPGT